MYYHAAASTSSWDVHGGTNRGCGILIQALGFISFCGDTTELRQVRLRHLVVAGDLRKYLGLKMEYT
jgi:hypothetical protein